ncbi:MAG: glutamine--fructose-6-phosphate transaminase (isomerizing) [Endomicrobium sp.]|jgi:glucosamine--fructose-6-phosphate aminotransferase (isomerizing)|nr:glutamine--fructose-6-phosphate transaminase (isomerizing) [Endomicrobium sp.]
MCGIVGYVGSKNAVDIIFDGLQKLEYRGYDSSGIAVVKNKKLEIRRSVGKLVNLKAVLDKKHLSGVLGIGHTRWATHGKPCEENAHPHTDTDSSIVVVHNGIIENYIELRNKLQKEGQIFKSETDTEVIAHLVKKYYKGDLFKAVKRALKDARGSYALGVICKDEPDVMVCARYDAPLIIGAGEEENFIASDIPALLSYTRNMIFLENGDTAKITKSKIKIENIDGDSCVREIKNIAWDAVMSEKDGYKHFMLKEIFEQPRTIEDTFKGRIYPDEGRVYIEETKLEDDFIKSLSKVFIVACGTSYHAALIAKFLFENLARIPVEVDIASEFRYRQPVIDNKTLTVVISQSGETADTLAALRLAAKSGSKTLAVCNVLGSSISREADAVVYTRCGPEIGVASTKAFTGQLAALYLLALDWAAKKETLSEKVLKEYIKELWSVPVKVGDLLKNAESIREIAKTYASKRDFLYLGRHVNYPIALEGALKLKEISYIHAEGYAAGEMKHGPIALIDEDMPIVAIAPKGEVYEKIISNISEAKARGGIIIAVASQGDKEIAKESSAQIYIPQVCEFFTPFFTIIPLQLLAYFTAEILGKDVDQPRNLAKSVTVE